MDRENLVEKVISITSKMISKAEQASWQELAELESRRKVILEDYFAEPVNDQYAAQAESMIRQVLEADKKIIALVNEHKQRYIKEHSSIKDGQRATQAYQMNQK